MKTLIFMVFFFQILLVSSGYAGTKKAASRAPAQADDKLTNQRIRAVNKYVAMLAKDPNSDIAKAIKEASPFEQLEGVQAVETESEINGHPKDSREVRAYFVAVGYLERQERMEDENGDYRSNTAIYNSLSVSCRLTAAKYGAQAVQISCNLQK